MKGSSLSRLHTCCDQRSDSLGTSRLHRGGWSRLQRLSAFDILLLPGVGTCFEATAVLLQGKAKDCCCWRFSGLSGSNPRTYVLTGSVLAVGRALLKLKIEKLPLQFF